ncbi:hypothetical protein EIY72_15405 [Pseudomonas vancouverensis]|uniref:Uncharacterized protein n=1 Tax=Pseudomonas vancouverensis TaxID=95300 RepID=A0A4V2X8Z0_PSEVA|nr:hypothetical protein F7R09_19755 [Pseudomonas vancouverensis]TDB61595.1 hypothetical protein EIY72_15405 [Pseudomonas vancouverensis]
MGAAPAAVASVAYRDKLFTSRTLILKDDRTLPVVAARVEVLATDTEALAFLDASAEHELIKE